MQSMIDFSTWFLSQLPSFFMSEPVCYLWGMVLTAYIFRLILSLHRW